MAPIDGIRPVRAVGPSPAADMGLDRGVDPSLDPHSESADSAGAYPDTDFSQLLQSAQPMSSDALMSINPAVNERGGVSALQSISDTLQIDKMKMLGMLLKGASNRDPVDNLRATISMTDMDLQSRVTSKVIGKTVSAITQLSEPK